MSDTKKPAAKISLYPVSAAIWRNQNQKGVFYSVTFERSYKDDAGKWQTSSTFNASDLLLLAKVADQAHDRNSRAPRRDQHAEHTPTKTPPNADRGRALSRVPCPFFLSRISTRTQSRVSASTVSRTSHLSSFLLPRIEFERPRAMRSLVHFRAFRIRIVPRAQYGKFFAMRLILRFIRRMIRADTRGSKLCACATRHASGNRLSAACRRLNLARGRASPLPVASPPRVPQAAAETVPVSAPFGFCGACRVPLMGGAPMTANDNAAAAALPSGAAARSARACARIVRSPATTSEFPLSTERAREVGLSLAELSSRLWPRHARPPRAAQPARQCRGAWPRDGGAEQGRQQSEPDRPRPERRRRQASRRRNASRRSPKPARRPPPSARSWGARTGHDFQRDDPQ